MFILKYFKCPIIDNIQFSKELDVYLINDINEVIQIYNEMIENIEEYETQAIEGRLKTYKHIKKINYEFVCTSMYINAIDKVHADLLLCKKVHYKVMTNDLKNEFMKIYKQIEKLYKEMVK